MAAPLVVRAHYFPRAAAAAAIYYVYAAGTRKLFQMLAVSPQRLVLRQGADTLTLVRQP